MPAFELNALLGEARTRTRDGVVPAPMVHQMLERMARVKTPLHGPTVVTLALLEAARGEVAQARALLESVFWLHPDAVPAETLEYTFGWLVTDAAAAGEWSRVERFLNDPRRPDVPMLRLFDELVCEVHGRPPPADTAYRVRLPVEAIRFAEEVGANAERATRDRSSRAKSRDPLQGHAAPARVRPSTPLGVSGGGDTLQPVPSMLFALLTATPETAKSAAELAHTVLTSPRLRDLLMERATLLGGGSPDETLGAVRALCEDTLAPLVHRPGEVPLLRAASERTRSELLIDLETRIDRLTDACQDGSAPPMPELWREFVRFRRDFGRAISLSDPDARDLPHLVVVRLVRYLGAWLRLTKQQLPFAHAVFQFLEVEATRAGDEKAAQLARASAELCLPFELGR